MWIYQLARGKRVQHVKRCCTRMKEINQTLAIEDDTTHNQVLTVNVMQLTVHVLAVKMKLLQLWKASSLATQKIMLT